ncbi:MAG: hypothetical protein ABIZ04_21170 [Opitutus sp.]
MKPFDANAAAKRSLANVEAEAKKEADAQLRREVKGSPIDWDELFQEMHRKDFQPPGTPFSALNKSNPLKSIVGALRLIQMSCAREGGLAGVQVWVEATLKPLAGLRAELLAIAERLETSNPTDAEMLRGLCHSLSNPLLTTAQIDYELGRRDPVPRHPEELNTYLEAENVSAARRLGRLDGQEAKS